MIAGAEHLLTLRRSGLTIPLVRIRLDSDEDINPPRHCRLSPLAWWMEGDQIFHVRPKTPLHRLDLTPFAGMTVFVFGDGSRVQQLIDRLLACGAKAVYDGAEKVAENGKRMVQEAA